MQAIQPGGGATEAVARAVKLLVTVEEAAGALSLSRTFVYGLLASGQIFSIKIGGRRLVPVAALHEFVERLTALQKAS